MNTQFRSRMLAGTLLLFLAAIVTPAAARAAGKTYTDTKNGFSVTLPSGWQKLKPETSSTLFSAAHSNQAVVWLLSVTALQDKQEAAEVQKLITNQPTKFAKIVKEEFNKEFHNSCSVSSAQKKTLGTNSGGIAVLVCTNQGSRIVLRYFTFVRKTKEYSAVGIAKQSLYEKYKAALQSIDASITFSK